MEEADKDWMMIRMVGGWMLLLVLAHLGSPGHRAIKQLLLLLYYDYSINYCTRKFTLTITQCNASWCRQVNKFATSRLDRQTEEPAMSRNAVLCNQPAGQGNDFELIPTVLVESQHSVDGPTSRDFSAIYIVRELWGREP